MGGIFDIIYKESLPNLRSQRFPFIFSFIVFVSFKFSFFKKFFFKFLYDFERLLSIYSYYKILAIFSTSYNTLSLSYAQ